MKNYTSLIAAILLVVTLIPGRATAYCLKGTTASGDPVEQGICAGGDKYFGKTLNIYQRKPDGSIGSLIGTYKCKDKGGSSGIRNNHVVDIWQPDLEACQEFMNIVYEDDCQGRIYIQIMEE